MRAVLQRVSKASVSVQGEKIGSIEKGLLVFLGVSNDDEKKDLEYILDKTLNCRIFEDENHKMNLSLIDIMGEILIVSQFTLYGDVRKGRRPSFDKAGTPINAEIMYNQFIEKCKEYDLKVQNGKFQAMMEVEICNNGPVTILLDSKKGF